MGIKLPERCWSPGDPPPYLNNETIMGHRASNLKSAPETRDTFTKLSCGALAAFSLLATCFFGLALLDTSFFSEKTIQFLSVIMFVQGIGFCGFLSKKHFE